MIYMGGMRGYSATHRAGQAGGRGGQGGLGMRVGGTDDGGVRHGRGKRRQRETLELPKRLAACLSEGRPRPGWVQRALPLLPRQQAALYQPLGTHGQLGVNVALAQGHHTGSCGHKTTGLSTEVNVEYSVTDTRRRTGTLVDRYSGAGGHFSGLT